MKKKFKKKVDEIIRVNHAGEYGAQRIYSGQLKFCQKKSLKTKLKKIIKEEYEHYEYFNEVMIKKRTRPTLMNPLWHHGGYLLGVITALMGEKYVNACTEAVEEVIVEHYEDQIEFLEKEGIEKSMLRKIKKFQSDEDAHKNDSINSNRNINPRFFKIFTKGLTKLAIKVSKKL